MSPTKSARSPRVNTTAKPRLSGERIVEAGLALASRPGVLTISVRDLGAYLEVDPTAIYRHFRNKEQLMQALLDRLSLRAVAAVTTAPEDWQDRLREFAILTLTEFMKYPGVAVESVVLTTHGRGEADSVELMLDAFDRAGLPDEDIVRHYAMLASHILSVGSGIARSHADDSPADLETSPWFDRPLLVDHRTHPQLTRFGVHIASLGDRELYLLGVESVIESAERLGSARHGLARP